MKNLFLLFVSMAMIGCQRGPDIDIILESRYEIKMISSGRNQPQIKLSDNDLREVIILLHHRIPVADIQAHFTWSDQELRDRIGVLEENEFVRKGPSGEYLPTSMVITLGEGQALQTSTLEIASQIADVLEEEQEEIRRAYTAIPAFAASDAHEAGFFIFSDVILDNWQINFIERDFIRAERTPRHGMNYYHSFQEKEPDNALEAFGIYGNQMWGSGSYMAGVYGNRRSSGRHLLSLRKNDLVSAFGMAEDGDVSEFRHAILEEIVLHASDPKHSCSADIVKGLEDLGLMDDGTVRIPVLTAGDYEALSELAASYTDDIVRILDASRDSLRSEYERSGYSDEITFEEYLIWWYHFLYSEVTDQLAERGILSIPASGVTTYVVDWGEE